MNQLQILTNLLRAAAQDPSTVSAFINENINANVVDPFASMLPREEGAEYAFSGGSLNMIVTPAQPVALNSPFPKIGGVDAAVWNGETDKYAGEITVDELAFRNIQSSLLRATSAAGAQETAEGFMQKLLLAAGQSMDLVEKIARSEAIMTGKYTGKAQLLGAKGKKLLGSADYGVNRIVAAGDHDAADSTFWQDLSAAEQRNRNTTAVIMMTERTYVKVKANAANGVIEESRVQNSDGTYTVTISRLAKRADGTYDTASTLRDAEFSGKVIKVVKAQSFSVPNAQGQLVKLSFGADGYIAVAGSTTLGQLYVAPTVEGTIKGVAMGRFTYVESPRDWEAAVRVVSNFVPVVTEYADLTIIETGITL